MSNQEMKTALQALSDFIQWKINEFQANHGVRIASVTLQKQDEPPMRYPMTSVEVHTE